MGMLHVMLPVQYLRRPDKRLAEPQKRLMLAVLQTVLDDCQGTAARRASGQGSPPDRRAYLQAKAYLDSRDRTWPFSFENICEAVGLDADGLRRGLRTHPDQALE
jgi:hypothetical protein